jgi:hypothetical protein
MPGGNHMTAEGYAPQWVKDLTPDPDQQCNHCEGFFPEHLLTVLKPGGTACQECLEDTQNESITITMTTETIKFIGQTFTVRFSEKISGVNGGSKTTIGEINRIKLHVLKPNEQSQENDVTPLMITLFATGAVNREHFEKLLLEKVEQWEGKKN